MNVFLLEPGPDGLPDPIASARSHCDIHVVSQLKEAAQVLCSAGRFKGFDDAPYASVYEGHPIVKWASRDLGAWLFVREYARELARVHMRRTGRPHKSRTVVAWAMSLGDRPWSGGCRPSSFVLAMPAHLREGGPVEAYRSYYVYKDADWAARARRRMAAAVAVGSDRRRPGGYFMRWTGPGRRPGWMGPEPRYDLTDGERAACAGLPAPRPGRAGVEEYLEDFLEAVDLVLGLETPSREATPNPKGSGYGKSGWSRRY